MEIACPNCTRFYNQGVNIRDDSINRAPMYVIDECKDERDLQKIE